MIHIFLPILVKLNEIVPINMPIITGANIANLNDKIKKLAYSSSSSSVSMS